MTWRLCDADWNHWPAGLSDGEFFAQAADAGYDGVELGVYRVDEQLPPARLDRVRRLAGETGVAITMLLYSLPVERWPYGALGDPQATQALAREAVQLAEVSAGLGLDVLGIWPGADPPGTAWQAVVDGACVLADAVAPTGVRLALEYKPGTALATAVDALQLAELTNQGVLLDTGHAYAAGEDVPAVVRLLAGAGRLRHVHLGDAMPGAADDDLPLGRHHDPAPVVAALAEVRYAGAATFDLYGAVSTGALTGIEAGRESRAALGRA